MHLRLNLAGAAAAAVLLAIEPGAAGADGTADAWAGDGQVGSAARGIEAKAAGGTARRRTARPTCTYQLLDEQASATADRFAANGWGAPRGDGPGSWYRKICTSEAGGSAATIVWVPPRRTDPRALAEEATDRADIPLPELRLSPPVDEAQVVNLPTWLTIDPAQWRPVTSSATAGGVTATATAVPESVTWSMGNGDRVTCAGPGTVYDPAAGEAAKPGCTYTFRRSSARAPGGRFLLEATVTWRVSWAASGAPGGGSLGTVTRTTSVPIRVAEIQALNISGRQT